MPDDVQATVEVSHRDLHFTGKHHCLLASGYFTIVKKTYMFDPITDCAVLDYGRGIWPRESTWNWGITNYSQ